MGWFGDWYLYWNMDDRRIIRIRMNDCYLFYPEQHIYDTRFTSSKNWDTFDKWIENYEHNLSAIEDNSIGFDGKFFDNHELREKWFDSIKYPQLTKM